MVFEELIIAFIGIFVGFFISIFWERKKEYNELKKTKQLLQDDFKRLFDIMYESKSLIAPYLESEENMQLFVYELISKKFDIPFVVKFQVSLEFNFWKAITDSGSLIKLNLDEIKHVQNTYEFINEYAPLLEQGYNKWLDLLGDKQKFVDELVDVDKKEILHATYIYFSQIHEYCESMINVLYEEADTFDWIKYHMK